jgi:hypothetical protein
MEINKPDFTQRLVLIFYISEISTIIIRAFSQGCSNINNSIVLIFCVIQLLINTICLISSFYLNLIKFSKSYFYYIIILSLVCVNLAESVNQGLSTIQLFLNLFGYSFLLSFWFHRKSSKESEFSAWFLDSSHFLHIIFSLTIIIVFSIKLYFCEFSKLTVLSNFIELNLLGFILGVIHGTEE